METDKQATLMPNWKDKIQIFMSYAFNQFEFRTNYQKSEVLKGSIFRFEPPSAIIHYGVGAWGKCEDFSVLVKPLDNISDSDAIEITKMIDCFRGDAPYQYNINYGRRIVSEMWGFNRHGLYGRHLLQVTDYLREKGYALPYKNWSVEQLVEAGIYKLIE